jgi:phospholipase C
MPASSFNITTSHLPILRTTQMAPPGRAEHLKDEADFLAAAQAGSLPAVSFIKPAGLDNEHPNYADVLTGEVTRFRSSTR